MSAVPSLRLRYSLSTLITCGGLWMASALMPCCWSVSAARALDSSAGQVQYVMIWASFGSLPITPAKQEESEGYFEYLFEPSHQALLTDLLPNYIYVQILECLYQTSVGEHAARMAAMENATSNCKELVRSLTLVYNKARQAGITTELMDIVGGAEALRK